MDTLTPLSAYTQGSLNNSRSISVINTSSVDNTRPSLDNSSNSQESMSNGQKFTGEVIDIKNDEVTVRLSNDTIVSGKMSSNNSLNIGDIASFKVNKTGDSIIFEPVNAQIANEDSIIDRALSAAGLPRTLKNVEITKELLNNNMSIDKQSIVNILTQSFNNKGVSIGTLVAMNKAGIPITGDNALYMENFRNSEHRIVNQIENITSSIEESLKNTKNINTILSLNSTYTSLVEGSKQFSNMSIIDNNQLVSNVFTSANDGESIVNILNLFNQGKEVADKILDGSATLRETALAINKAYERAQVMDQDHLSGTNFTTSSGGSFSLNAKFLFMSPSIQNVLTKYARMQNENNELSSYMNDLGRATINSMIKGLPGSQNLSHNIWNGDISSKELINNLNNLINFMPKDKAAALIQSNEYITVLKQALTSEWTITPNELNSDQLTEKYQNMYDELEKLSLALSNNHEETTKSVSNNTSSLKNNISFMNTINEMFSYLQLPMRLRGQNVHTELYVMTNKKKLAKDNSNISVLLHLDMDNLKPLDVNINLSNNTVDAKFYMSDKSAKDLIDANLELLELNLMEKGFLFTGKVFDKREDTDVVKNFINEQTPSTPMKRYAFDIRM